jgi:hypothetical protein
LAHSTSLGEIAGGGTHEARLGETVVLTVPGVDCRCLTLHALIRVRRAAGRVTDLEALAELEAIREEQA